MFFRNKAVTVHSFDERLKGVHDLGFSTNNVGGRTIVSRNGYGAILQDMGEGKVGVTKAGLVIGSEVATLMNAGYQMFFRTPAGKEIPAQADQLKALHAFDEDLYEGLGKISLYNLSLGTTTAAHMYDRVEDRDKHSHTHPWER
jgi:hypothetical protein